MRFPPVEKTIQYNWDMRILVFLNSLGMGGTEKAACRWTHGLQERGHEVSVLALTDGPRRVELERHNISIRVTGISADKIASVLREIQPDVIHAHAPGHPHDGDVLGDALKLLPKIPVVQTNVFGHLYNPREDAWTDFRLFVSWSSCVQAAWRTFQRLDEKFFERASVAVNPLDPEDGPSELDIREFRESLGIKPDEVVFGQLCRPDPGRWTDIPLQAFREAQQACGNFRFLIREPPSEIAKAIKDAPDAGRFLILPVTSDPVELNLTIAAMDVALHYSSVGESFGYGIAEPMNLGKPAIVNFAPWNNMAPLELVRPGECGFAVVTPASITKAIMTLGSDREMRQRMGEQARSHIRQLADPTVSLDRLESALNATVKGRVNPLAREDLRLANAMAHYLRKHQFGQTLKEKITLRPFYYRVRFHQFRKRLRTRFWVCG